MASLSDSRLLLAASLSAAAGAAMVFLLSPYEKKQLSSSGDSSHGSEATTRSASPPEPPATDAASQTLTSVQQTWTWRYSLYSGTLAAAMGALGAVAVGYVVSGRWRSVWLGRAFRARVVGIIPARYHSSRFPGKPLANILGKAMIQRTWEQARQAKTLEAVVIATDDERIAAYCRDFGAEVVMTSPECENGTVRCCEAMEALGTQRWDAVVNIQGDEPLVDPAAIDAVVMALQGAPRAVCSTAVAPLDLSDARNSNRVKCVVDRKGYAMYFSRALIPANK